MLSFKAVPLYVNFSVTESVHMAVPATQIRRGMVIVFEGDPCRVVEFRHHTPGNLRAMVQAKLKNLRTGSSFEHRFRAADSIEPASMETHELEFMYQGGDTYHFMNTENYDQIEMDEETLGDNAPWMQPGMKIQAEYLRRAPDRHRAAELDDARDRRDDPGDEDGDEDGVDEAGEARERRDGERAGVRGDGRQGPRESEHRRVHRAREVTRSAVVRRALGS